MKGRLPFGPPSERLGEVRPDCVDGLRSCLLPPWSVWVFGRLPRRPTEPLDPPWDSDGAITVRLAVSALRSARSKSIQV